jgi:hypothetical protein
MSYLITVTQIEHDVPFTTRTWKKLVDVPDEKHEEIYGYVKEDITKDVETKIYEQTVDNLDLSRLVLTINSEEKIT